MFMPNMGIAELLTSLVAVMLGLAFPVGVLYLLFKIYAKLQSIEDMLKKR